MDLRPFTLDVPQPVLDDLQDRLLRTRWPNEPEPETAEGGPSLATMRRLVERWADGYDWRAAERSLNRLHQYLAHVRGRDVHLVHERSARADAVPVVLLHGWADSIVRFVHLVDLLATPADDGTPAFHVVVPSLPGFGFSEQPGAGEVGAAAAAEVVADLMAGLGYDRYVVHGGDWGGAVAQELTQAHPDRVAGLHLTDVPFPNFFAVDRADASPAEVAFLEAVDAWGETETAYVSVHSTRPRLLSYALADSPVGLLSWLHDHFERYSETPIADDDLLTNAMLYWVTNTIRSSIRYYAEGMGDDWDAEDGSAATGEEGGEDGSWDAGTVPAGDDDGAGWATRVEVPTALALFPRDIGRPPRELAERFFDVVRFTQMPRGGHFAALEEPGLLAEDLRAFVRDVVASRTAPAEPRG